MLRRAIHICTRFLKKEPVLWIAALAAILSMFFVPPSPAYVEYIDFRVLALLFCLMAVVAGLQDCGLFLLLAQRLLSGRRKLRLLSLILVLLPFFASMFVTNDVALITFVPFAILVLGLTQQQKHLIYILTLQTIAANLGSMLMPVGNPQNLFLYAKYQIPTGSFFAVMLPLVLLSLVGLSIAAFCVPAQTLEVHFEQREQLRSIPKLLLFAGLFLLCLLSVFRVLAYPILLGIVLVCLLLFARPVFRRVDYGLLCTFVFFFVFAGNIGNIPAVRQWLTSLLLTSPALVSAAASQVISNVPAAVLLSGFTDNWLGLLIGTNIGGLGTIIASLASLITFKFYLRTEQPHPGKYLAVFTAANLAGLLILFLAALAMGNL